MHFKYHTLSIMKVPATLLLASLMLILPLSAMGETRQAPAVEEKIAIPSTLAQAHAQLEEMLPEEELQAIDAMASEKDMIKYHLSLGMWIRNNWGLWQGSALQQHMQALGFVHPDDMSDVILYTFWCKRHHQYFRLQERAEQAAAYWEAARQQN